MKTISFSSTNPNPAVLQTTLQGIFDLFQGKLTIISSDFLRNPITGQFSVNLVAKVTL